MAKAKSYKLIVTQNYGDPTVVDVESGCLCPDELQKLIDENGIEVDEIDDVYLVSVEKRYDVTTTVKLTEKTF